MRIYQNCHEMYSDVKRDLHEMGTLVHPQTMQDKHVGDDEQYQTLELSPYGFTILDGSDRDTFIRDLGYNFEWCMDDFGERIGPAMQNHPGLNPGNAHKHRPEWAEFLRHGRFAYTYSERLALIPLGGAFSALKIVIRELMQNPNTRQAVLPIFNASIDLNNAGGVARIPCSMHYQFLHRHDGLHAIYTMRSTDFKTHFPYDIWHALELQKYIADCISDKPARLTFFTGSLHIYKKDADPGVF